MTKRKLSKLLNKKLQYTAIREQKNDNIGRVLLKNIEHNNKLYADHVWVLPSAELNSIDTGSRVSFYAKAYMYNDKFNVRKEGLSECTGFHKASDNYSSQLIKDKKNARNKRLRKK